MNETSTATIQSGAFQRALLHSEQLRLRGLLLVLGVGLAALTVWAVVVQDPGERHVALLTTVVFGAAAAFVAFAAVTVERALRAGGGRPPLLMTIGPLVETLVPTLSLLAVAQAHAAGPVRAVAGPAVVAYYLLIMLSILRLSPALSLLTGVTSAAGYVAVYFGGVKEQLADGPNPALTTGVFVTQVLMLVVATVIASAVAGRVRSHVAAALREEAALREVERYQGELKLAQQIQQGLLPEAPPVITGFEVAGWNRPADETGGDYYDFIPAVEGGWTMVVADVTGHGIAPALVMSACRAYLRACLSTAAGLPEAFTITSGRLLDDLPRGKFVTLAAAHCSPGSSQVDLLSAGHGPLLHYRSAWREVVELESHGIPLGMLPGFPYSNCATLELAAGDLLVMLTDGFWEWENAAGEQFGVERLKRSLVAAASRPAADIITHLETTVQAFAAGARQGDDLTAIVVRKL